MDTQIQPQPSAEFAAFDAGLRKVLAVPKAEIDRREQEWRKAKDAKKAAKVRPSQP